MSTRQREKAAVRREIRKAAPPQATLTGLKVGPNKVRQVAGEVEGLSVAEALSRLAFSAKGAARPLRKLISSAIANAERKGGVDLDALRVLKVRVDMGPHLKRFMPRAQGRATRIKHRTSHVTVFLGV